MLVLPSSIGAAVKNPDWHANPKKKHVAPQMDKRFNAYAYESSFNFPACGVQQPFLFFLSGGVAWPKYACRHIMNPPVICSLNGYARVIDWTFLPRSYRQQSRFNNPFLVFNKVSDTLR